MGPDLNGNGYMLCRAEPMDDNSDGLRFETVTWGYDSAAEAFRDLEKLLADGKYKDGELAVIRLIDVDDDE